MIDQLKDHNKRMDEQDRNVKLPDDVQAVGQYPDQVMQWFKVCGLTQKHLLENEIVYSPSKEWVIFPFYTANVLTGFQARGFSKTGPKWYNAGQFRDHLELIFGEKWPVTPGVPETLVIVEDMVSAIRVGDVANACPAFGCAPSMDFLKRLSSRYKHLIFWFDHDALNSAINAAVSVKHLHPAPTYGYVLHTECDPKLYTEEEILVYLQGINLASLPKEDNISI